MISKRVQLEDNPSEHSLFKILPCYKYQNELDKFIRFSDDVYIASSMENLNKEAYLVLNIQGNRNSIHSNNEYENEDSGTSISATDDFMITFEKSTKFR